MGHEDREFNYFVTYVDYSGAFHNGFAHTDKPLSENAHIVKLEQQIAQDGEGSEGLPVTVTNFILVKQPKKYGWFGAR